MTFGNGDRVKSPANLYDEGTEDEHGQTFSQIQLNEGLGEFCFGKVSFVYRKIGRNAQKYRVKWDNGDTTVVFHQHLEPVSVQDDVGGIDESQIDPDDEFGGHVTVETDNSDDENEDSDETRPREGEVTRVGGRLTVGNTVWKRVSELRVDSRERHERFDLMCKDFGVTDHTTEVDLFWFCMPVSRETLTGMLRARAGRLLILDLH